MVLALLAKIERIGADRKACWEEFKVQGRQLDQLKAENEELRQSERYSDQIIETRNRLLKSIPACPVHGEDCVPHAQEWVEAARQDAERYRWLRDKSESVHQFYLSTPIWFTGVKFRREDVDRTIDAAMAKESSHG